MEVLPFSSHNKGAGAQRGQVVFPPTLLGGRDAVSNDKVSALGTDSVLPWEH